ncbi:MAG TPA: cupin domain-containing protein [Patescibacteria group bacterium]|nr:cupin domain-containing protein [Patescibacteria group bacterium]
MKLTQKEAFSKHKYGIDLKVYPIKDKKIGLVRINCKTGHFEEFYNKKSTLTYYVLEGKGEFYLNGEKVKVKATDVVSIPPKTKTYYLGKMRLILITTPAWEYKDEMHVRNIKK